MRNIEIKACVRNLEELIKNVKRLSNSNGQVIKQHDTFFKVPQGRLKLRRFEGGNAELIYYERPDTEGPKMSSYEKSSINEENVNNMSSVLDKALGATTVVKKIRQLFLIGQTRIHIDSVENLGDFLEFEVVLKPDQSPEDGEIIAHSLMKQLDIKEEDLLSNAYADLLDKQVNK